MFINRKKNLLAYRMSRSKLVAANRPCVRVKHKLFGYCPNPLAAIVPTLES